MKIAASAGTLQGQYGPKECIRVMAEIGYDAIDYPVGFKGFREELCLLPEDEFIAYFKDLGDYAKECGIEICQTHGATPAIGYGKNDTPELNEQRLEHMRRSLIATAAMGCKICVVHPPIRPDHKYGMAKELNKEDSYRIYRYLLPTIEKYDLIIGLENMFLSNSRNRKICPAVLADVNEMLEYIEDLGEKHFRICYDIGHANVTSHDPISQIRLCGKYLACIHAHDNDGVRDLHWLPCFGNMPWEEMMKVMREIDYKGVFSMEVTMPPYAPADTVVPFYTYMLALAKSMVKHYFYGE